MIIFIIEIIAASVTAISAIALVFLKFKRNDYYSDDLEDIKDKLMKLDMKCDTLNQRLDYLIGSMVIADTINDLKERKGDK